MDVTEIINDWYEAAENAGQPTNGAQFLRVALPHLLAGDSAVGLATKDASPVVIAVSGRRLLCFEVTEPGGGESEPELRVGAVPLADSTALDVDVTMEHLHVHASFLARIWVLTPPAGPSLTLKTHTKLGMHDSPYLTGDEVMIVAAELLGWPLASAGATSGPAA